MSLKELNRMMSVLFCTVTSTSGNVCWTSAIRSYNSFFEVYIQSKSQIGRLFPEPKFTLMQRLLLVLLVSRMFSRGFVYSGM